MIGLFNSKRQKAQATFNFCKIFYNKKMENSKNLVSSPGLPKKLHGYDFYRSIGSPKYICAPMVE